MGVLAELIKQSRQQQFDKDTQQLDFYTGAIKGGNLSPVPNPNNDPQIDAENQKRQSQLAYAQTQITKLGGKDPNTKGLIGQAFEHIGKLHKQGAGGPAAGGGGTSTTAAGAGAGGTAAAPTANGPGLPSPPSTGAPSPTTPPAKPSPLPAPPSMGSVGAAAYPSPEAVAASQASSKLSADLTARKADADASGFPKGSREYNYLMAGQRLPTTFTPKPGPKALAGADIVKSYGPGVQTLTGEPLDPAKPYDIMYGADGAPYASPTGLTAAQRAPDHVVKGPGGLPNGVVQDGKLLLPGMPGWNDKAQAIWDADKGNYDKSQKDILSRQETSMDRYAKMRGQVQMYNVYNNDTGEMEEVNANTMNASPPGTYAGGTAMQTQRNRQAVFDELDQSVSTLNSAINKLGNESFSAADRAEIASTLINQKDAGSTVWSFAGSEVANHLTEAQKDYVIAIINAQESAMAIRSIGGVPGAGSDQLRGAVLNMLPGAGTPSKAWAQQQMKVFGQQISKLKGSLPTNIKGPTGSAAKPGLPTPPAAPSAGASRNDPLGIR